MKQINNLFINLEEEESAEQSIFFHCLEDQMQKKDNLTYVFQVLKNNSQRAVRPAHATVLQHKKPASSAADGITGGSRLTSQTVLRQEVPTATSKSYTFKTSIVI
ncbi:BnaC05g51060D [Brassica napus]|uniref:(rape) hypothetical protein n=1 Tax=Brassica napus TaxID=3708 RepID=A0A078IWR8_BRANA|nr:unnamed protein product [Brassica napus]CDY56186.1 BnaC05g51060D [Brassica napus]